MGGELVDQWLLDVALFSFALLYAAVREKNSLRNAWFLAAKQLGLKFGDNSDGEMTISGSLGGYGVRLVAARRGKVVNTELSLKNPGMPGGVTLKSEGGWQSLRKVALGQDILTGDEAFDALINVGKDEPTALALLDATARARVISFVRGWEARPRSKRAG